VLIQKALKTGEMTDCCKLLKVMTSVIYADETGLFFSFQPSETLTFKVDSCRGGTHAMQCNAMLMLVLKCHPL
jgi:hypothetical protein